MITVHRILQELSAAVRRARAKDESPCWEFEIHPEHCEMIRRCKGKKQGHAGPHNYGVWV